MKKFFKFWALMTLVLCAGMANMACSKDNDDEGTKINTKFAIKDLNDNYQWLNEIGDGFYSFGFDDKHYLTSVSVDGKQVLKADIYMYFTDEDLNLYKLKFNDSGLLTKIEDTFTLDDMEKISGTEAINLEYNEDGTLKQAATYISGTSWGRDGTTYSMGGFALNNYTWENDKLMKVTINGQYNNRDYLGELIEYTYNEDISFKYGNTPNPLRQGTLSGAFIFDSHVMTTLELFGFLGKFSDTFPVSMVDNYYDSDGEQGSINYEMSYTTNENGTIDTETYNGKDYGYLYSTVETRALRGFGSSAVRNGLLLPRPLGGLFSKGMKLQQ